MAPTRLGSLLILTEDSGREGHATIVEVVKRMLRLLVPDYQTHKLGFEPKDEETQRGVQGTGWKSNNPRDKAAFVIALRTIATKLGRPDGFVFFHIDGDRTWKDRASSENKPKFQRLVVERIREILRRNEPRATPESIAEKLCRLHVVMPFYSIEAWLYQHTDVALRIARERYGGRDIDLFQSWKQDRTLLDDVEKPKEAVCLGSAHNLVCAGSGYPAQEVADASRSYADCYRELKGNTALVTLLQQTAGREPETS